MKELWLAGVGIALGAVIIAAGLAITVPTATPPPSVIEQLNHMPQEEFKSMTPEEREKLLDQLPSYGTIREAGIAGLQRAVKCSMVYECGGVIAQRPDGRFVVGPVRTDYSGDSVEIPRGVPPGWLFVGDFHTHPCHPKSHADEDFSTDDLQLLAIHYMGELCNGHVHEYVPGSIAKYTFTAPLGVDEPLTQGEVVATIELTPVDVDANPGL